MAASRHERSTVRRGRALSLSSSLPPSSGNGFPRPAPRQAKPLSLSLTSSAPISLPKSHIHRTPSELQLADDMRRAEYEDVRMYARLVSGMQSQCLASGYVHPQTRRIIQDIVKTKEANDQELEAMHHHEETDDDWDVNFIEEEEHEHGIRSHAHFSQNNFLGASATSTDNIVTSHSNSSISNAPGKESDVDDDSEEGVFSMDL